MNDSTPGKGVIPPARGRGRRREEAGGEASTPAAAARTAAGGAVFVNLTNHPSRGWSLAQREAARRLAPRIVDLPFPPVPPEAGTEEIERLAARCLEALPAGTTHALVQGEFALTHALVAALRARGIVCLPATTRREVVEHGDGSRTSRFAFVRFRPYPEPKPDP